jgi:selenocysteine-specific elongation factor
VARAAAGERVALNLAGIDREEVRRGDTVAAPGAVTETMRFDARVEVRPASGRALASHLRVRVHHGTRETIARLVWLDGVAEVAPRHSAFAQLTLEEPLVAMPGDRFVIRDETASRTLGGGVVLAAHASRHRRSHGEVAPSLTGLEDVDAATRVVSALGLESKLGMPIDEAAAAASIDPAVLKVIVSSDERLELLGDDDAALVVLRERLSRVESSVAAAVAAYQAAHANLAGVDVEHLRGSVKPAIDAKTFRHVLDRLVVAKVLLRSGNVVRTRGHEASLGAADEALAGRALARIGSARFMPPTVKELASELGADASRLTKVAAVLVLRGEVVKIATDLFFTRAAVDEIGAMLTAHLREKGEISPAGFRDLIAASRKYCIPLLDWFDREGLTMRVGDLRRLRRP